MEKWFRRILPILLLMVMVVPCYGAEYMELRLTVERHIEGDVPANEQYAKYVLTADEGTTLPDGHGVLVAETDGEGTSSFPGIHYYEDGTYRYTVTRKIADKESGDPYKVQVVISDNVKTMTTTINGEEGGTIYYQDMYAESPYKDISKYLFVGAGLVTLLGILIELKKRHSAPTLPVEEH